jgi:hypothetical protein
MHAALQALDGGGTPPPARAPAPRARPRAFPVALGVTAGAALLGLAVLALRPALGPDAALDTTPVATAPTRPADPVASPLSVTTAASSGPVAVAETAAPAVTAATAEPAAAAAPLPAAEPTAAAPRALPAPAAADAAPAPAPSMPPSMAPSDLDAARAGIVVTRATTSAAPTPPPAEAAAPPEAADAAAIARAVAAVEQSMRMGDLDAAGTAIEQLAQRLPARSLTLQRMQAWHAHQSGRTVEAIALYRDITQRMPGDRNAAINLALLEAAQGDVDGAQRRLRALRASGGDSAELAAAMAQVGGMPR